MGGRTRYSMPGYVCRARSADPATLRAVPAFGAEVDEECMKYRRNPGPGTYEPVTTMDLKHSVLIQRDYIPNEGTQ